MKCSLKILSSMLLVTILLTLSAAPVLAFDARSGDTVTIASGEVVDDDLYLAGGDIIIDGTVNGDVFAVGRTVAVNGTVNGAVTLAAQNVMIRGTVGRSARLAGQNVDIMGNIAEDAVAMASMVNISTTAGIGRDLIMGASSARVNGPVSGNIKAGCSEIQLGSSVGGNASISAEKITLASNAIIKGNLDYTSTQAAAIQPGAMIEGKTNHIVPPPSQREKKGPLQQLPGKVLAFFMAFIAGLILILISPGSMARLADAIRKHTWLSLGWGALFFFATPIAIIILFITVVGIPLGLILMAMYGIGLYLSQIPVSLCIGRSILARVPQADSKKIMIGALALGLAILILLKWIPVLGIVVTLATFMFGLGSLFTGLTKGRSSGEV
jgi:cytoskeletal protein CcmA (bactofilin family)